MSIKIEQVNVKNLGPLNDFSCTLKQVNLFYGHNEHGKTYLVEFIYKSLFKNKALGLRELSASGQVIVSGLEEKESLFSTSTKKKLEDFWEDGLPGLPRDFSKLLVVKGADLDLSSGSPAGIDEKILKEFLSGEGLLEKIGSRINPTEGSATYENGKISGQNRGNVAKYNDTRAGIQQIDDAIRDVNANISGGRRFELNQKIEGLIKQKDDQEQARRHLAFNLANQSADLKTQLEELPAELISNVDKLILTHQQKKIDLEKKQQDLEKNQELSKDYLWLDSAVIGYQKLILAGNSFKPHSGVAWMVFSMITIALAVVLVLIQQPYVGVGMILLAVLFSILYLRGFIKSRTNIAQQEEMEKIVNGFRSQFGTSDVVQEATLVAKQKELQPAYFAVEQLTRDIETLTGELNDLEQQINHDLKKLPGPKNKKGEWQTIIKALQDQRDGLDTKIRKKEIELSSLTIDETDYLQEPVAVPYDPRQLHIVQTDLDTCIEELREAEEGLQGLKQVVCTLTRKDITSLWEDLVEALNNKRQDEVNRYKNITAGILAQIKVNEVLGDLRKIEEERIEEGLNSSVISQAVLATTGHYDRVEKEDRELYVAESFGRYRVSDLSTGAREQVLLGLRIGFAARILAGTPLFLILDDAFQHSDWERRERLVRKLFTLSRDGWQIIYFTMDDHIRKLFESNAKEAGKDQYQTIMLP
jgi:uncharacterized protein YhaN